MSIVVVFLCTITVGAFFALLWFANSTVAERGKPWRRVVIAILMALAIGLGVSRMLYWDVEIQEDIWNNGICARCGGEMEFKNASHTRTNNTYYYFQCEDCGNIIELNRNPY